MKIIGNLKIQNLKEKDSILIEPCLIYIGETLCFFYELIYKKNSYSKRDELLNNKEKNFSKITLKDSAYFGLICLLFLIIDFYKIFILLFSQNISFASYCMLIKSSIFLILFSNLICYFAFKIKIYKHHKLVIYFFSIYGIILTILIILCGQEYDFALLFIQIVISSFESITLILIKHIMEKKFLSPFKICYLIGFFNFIISFIILIILSNIKCNSNLSFCKEEDEYIFDYSFIINTSNNNFFYILIGSFLFLLLYGITKYIINAILKKYTIFYSILFYQISSPEYLSPLFFKIKFREKDDSLKVLLIIFYIFTIFEYIMNLIYLEEIELNFCGLNRNIKRNIQTRADEEVNNIGQDHEDSKIEFDLDGGFSSNFNENNNDSGLNEIELNRKSNK